MKIGPVPERKTSPAQEQAHDAEKQETPAQKAPKEKSWLDSIIDRLSQGAVHNDDGLMRSALQEYERSDLGKQFAGQVAQAAEQQAAQERQAAWEAQQQALASIPARQGPAMMM